MTEDHDAGRVTYFRPLDGWPLLVVFQTVAADNEIERLKLESRGFSEVSCDSPGTGLPFGFSQEIRPVTCSPNAIADWVDLIFKSLTWLEQDQLAGNEALNSVDRDGKKQNATDIVRDTFLLVDELATQGWSDAPTEPTDEAISFRAARIKLREVREWIGLRLPRQESSSHIAANSEDNELERTGETPTETLSDRSNKPSNISDRRWEAAFHRDHVWLRWRDEGLEPPAIRKRWNALSDAERERLAKNPNSKSKVESNQVVWIGLEKAATERSVWQTRPSNSGCLR